MSLLYYLRLFRRRWLGIAYLALIGIIIGGVVSLLQPPLYKAESQAFVSTQDATSIADLSQGITFAQQTVKSYAAVATSPYVLTQVIRKLGLKTTPEQLGRSVSAAAAADTSVLQIDVAADSPSRAAAIANAVTQQLSAAIQELTPAGTAATTVKVTQIQPAVPPRSAAAPIVPLNLGIGLLLGALAGAALAVLLEVMDTRLRSAAQLAEVSDRPVLGALLRYQPGAEQRSMMVQKGPPGEALRSLRANLQFLNIGPRSRLIVLTSSIEGEGKTTSCCNLAESLAENGSRVLLVDADLRRPMIADYAGLDGSVGLVDVLIGSVSFDEAAQSFGSNGLTVLPAGRVPPNPNELLQSAGMQSLLDQLRERYDVVLFDTPPLLPVSDGAVLAKLTDGAVLLAALNRVRQPQVRAALRSLEQIGARVLGIVVNMVEPDEATEYAYGYYSAVIETAT